MSVAYAHGLYEPLPENLFEVKFDWDPTLLFFVAVQAAFQQAVADIGMDILVIISGTLLRRTELQNRAESLKTIWAKAQSREESLKRAEAGLGVTLWTSRMRKKKSKD